MTIRLKQALIIFTLLISGCFSACKKEAKTPTPEPKPTATDAKISLQGGSGQSGTYGEDLSGEISFKISPPAGSKAINYLVQFVSAQGNGVINSGNVYANVIQPDTNGILKVKWRLGCNRPDQKLKAYVYPFMAFASGDTTATLPAIDSIVVSATGSKPAGWGRACGCGTPDMYNAQMVTFDKQTLYLASRGLFSSTDGGINWAKVKLPGVPKWQGVVGAQFNSKGWMYIITENDGIFYTKDMKTWTAINNGILDHRQPTGLLVTDDLLMVGFYFDGAYITTDNGGFWRKMLIDISQDSYYFMKRHTNGNLYLSDYSGALYISKDVGKTWQALPTDIKYYHPQLSSFDIGPDGYLYLGSGDANIAKVSPETLVSTGRSLYESNNWYQTVHDIQFYNNDVFFLVMAAPRAGVYSMNSWSRVELNFPQTIYSFFTRPDGKFLLVSDGGLYYRN